MDKHRKLLSAICHGSVWLNSLVLSIGIPIAVMLLNDDPVVKANAKEALNVHINLLVAYVVFGVLCFVLVGIPLVVVAGIYNLVMPLLAICAVATLPDIPYRYPFIFHIIDSRSDPLLPPS